jgi:DNA-binding MarR family transcriptional regulator
MYEEELHGTGLRVTQFTLLQALEIGEAMTQGELGSLLRLDSTTLTRSLRPLIDYGWVRSEPGSDRRERHIRLSASGKRKVAEATPSWRRAQQRMRKAAGRNWDLLERSLLQITGAKL